MDLVVEAEEAEVNSVVVEAEGVEEEEDLVAEVEAEAVMGDTLVGAAVAATWVVAAAEAEVEDSGDVVVDAKYKCTLLLT